MYKRADGWTCRQAFLCVQTSQNASQLLFAVGTLKNTLWRISRLKSAIKCLPPIDHFLKLFVRVYCNTSVLVICSFHYRRNTVCGMGLPQTVLRLGRGRGRRDDQSVGCKTCIVQTSRAWGRESNMTVCYTPFPAVRVSGCPPQPHVAAGKQWIHISRLHR